MRHWVAACCTFLLAAIAHSDAGELRPTPPDRWLERASGYEEGRAWQQEHKADMVLFIASRSPAGPARRSRQFENDILRDRVMREFLEDYVKVKLTIPSDPDTNALALERFRVQHGPRLLVVRPGGFAMPVRIFLRDGDDRVSLTAEEIIQRIRAAGTPSRSSRGGNRSDTAEDDAP